MRAFIVLSVVALACGQYNYQPGGSDQASNGISFTSPGSVGGGFTGRIGGGFNGAGLDGGSNGATGAFGGIGDGFGGVGAGSDHVAAGPASVGGGFGGVSGGGPANGDDGTSNFGSTSNGVPASVPQAELVSATNDAPSSQASAPNVIYTYSVDENDFVDPEAQRAAESVQKPSRVVFIRGPQNKGLEDAALALAKQAVPQTAIYVLSRSSDIGDLANKLNNINSNNRNQPEVHFVKYRTPEDAANAQKAIQDQYDSLGGRSSNINGGVAPVINFASQAPVAAPSAAAPRNNYLPASVFRN